MKADLHTHTEHSFDCKLSVKSLIQKAEKAGIDAVAITDHDSMSACGIAKKLAKSIVVIPGMEITAQGGTHIIGLFLKDEIVSRDIFDIINEIHNQGGLALIPHPFRPGSGLIFNKEKQNMFSGEETMRILSDIDLIEAVNFRCPSEETVNTERFFSCYPDIPHTAGSDAHHGDEIGKAYVELEKVKSDSLEDIKKALLSSPRTIRFEAYSEEAGWETRVTRVALKKKSLIVRSRQLFTPHVRQSLRALYQKSAGKLVGRRRKKIREKQR